MSHKVGLNGNHGSGSDGFTTLDGTSGDDILNGGNGKNIINGGDGNDLITGGNGKDVLNGDAGDDTLYGGNGNDMLNGGDGNDTLNGGIGHDVLTGGAGADTFAFDSTALKGGSDEVTDFTPTVTTTATTTTTDPVTGLTTTSTTTTTVTNDVLELHNLLQGYDPLTSQLSDFVHFTQVGANTVVSVDTNGAVHGAHFTAIATLDGITGLDPAALLASGNIVIS
jgi:Ca2+-binding RTX toxin-like protein